MASCTNSGKNNEVTKMAGQPSEMAGQVTGKRQHMEVDDMIIAKNDDRVADLMSRLESAHTKIMALEREVYKYEDRATAAEARLMAVSTGQPTPAHPSPRRSPGSSDEEPEEDRTPKKLKTEDEEAIAHVWDAKTIVADETTYPAVLRFVRDAVLPLYKTNERVSIKQYKFKLDYEQWRKTHGGPDFAMITTGHLLVAALPTFERLDGHGGSCYNFDYNAVKAFFEGPSPFAGMRMVDKSHPFPVCANLPSNLSSVKLYIKELVDKQIYFLGSRPMNVYTDYMRWCISQKIDQIMSYLAFSREMRRIAPDAFKVEDGRWRGVSVASFDYRRVPFNLGGETAAEITGLASSHPAPAGHPDEMSPEDMQAIMQEEAREAAAARKVTQETQEAC
jgi:hypothetical protein